MKNVHVKVDTQNQVVVATPTELMYNNDGKPVKVVVRCHDGDTFDADFGERYAKSKLTVEVLKSRKQDETEFIAFCEEQIKVYRQCIVESKDKKAKIDKQIAKAKLRREEIFKEKYSD